MASRCRHYQACPVARFGHVLQNEDRFGIDTGSSARRDVFGKVREEEEEENGKADKMMKK